MSMTAAATINISVPEFRLIQELMYSHAGVRLTDVKMLLVENRLRKHVERLGLRSFKQYHDVITQDAHAEELRQCLNALTTNETYFFRHKEHWDFIAQVVVPEWKKSHMTGSAFRVWSAAASIGAEAYSTALLLHEILPEDGGHHFEIEATDINQNVLDKAKRAEFDDYAVQKITPKGLKQYFRHDTERRLYRLTPQIASLVGFRRQNLLEPSRGPAYDLVLLRNVLIYFDEASKAQVVARVMSRMRGGSYLFLGGAESLSAHREHFEMVKPTILRRRA